MAYLGHIKQKDNFSCGPIAVMYATRWAGGRVRRSDLGKFQDKCKCTSDGTCMNDVGNALELLCENIEMHKRLFLGGAAKCVPEAEEFDLKARHIDKWLDDGHVMIVSYDHKVDGDIEGHIVFVSGRGNDYYVVHNASKDRVKHWSRRSFLRRIREAGEAWFIRKKGA